MTRCINIRGWFVYFYYQLFTEPYREIIKWFVYYLFCRRRGNRAIFPVPDFAARQILPLGPRIDSDVSLKTAMAIGEL